MIKIKPITQDLVVDYEYVKNSFNNLESKIIDRIDYIIRTIFKTFNNNLNTWYFLNAEEGEVGNLIYEEPEISMIWDTTPFINDMIIIDKNDQELLLSGCIPTAWLFYDFEQELEDGKKKYEDKEAARKSKKKKLTEAQKKEDAILTEIAKKKLSKKELAALRRSL